MNNRLNGKMLFKNKWCTVRRSIWRPPRQTRSIFYAIKLKEKITKIIKTFLFLKIEISSEIRSFTLLSVIYLDIVAM